MKRLELPPDEGALRLLEAGEEVELFGDALTMRDAAHRRLVSLLEAGEEPPFDVAGQLIFYAGPTPATGDRAVGAIGPTTSARMDRYLEMLFTLGVRSTLGKGPRSEEARQLHQKCGAVYLAAVGGVAALFGSRVESAEVLAWEDLGPEAVRRVRLRGLPAVVAIDARGTDHLAAQYRAHGQRQV
ncbi:MAG TPA: FumA C-terminus/TtdB family hydratase beta subunit [Candidatus Anoxymicrobiaceae bacterium]